MTRCLLTDPLFTIVDEDAPPFGYSLFEAALADTLAKARITPALAGRLDEVRELIALARHDRLEQRAKWLAFDAAEEWS